MRVVHRSNGQQFFKRILLKIFPPGNQKPKRQMYRAAPGKILSPENVDGILASVAENIEQQWFPGHAYRFVPVGAGEFNFVHEDDCTKCHAEAIADWRPIPEVAAIS